MRGREKAVNRISQGEGEAGEGGSTGFAFLKDIGCVFLQQLPIISTVVILCFCSTNWILIHNIHCPSAHLDQKQGGILENFEKAWIEL